MKPCQKAGCTREAAAGQKQCPVHARFKTHPIKRQSYKRDTADTEGDGLCSSCNVNRGWLHGLCRQCLGAA